MCMASLYIFIHAICACFFFLFCFVPSTSFHLSTLFFFKHSSHRSFLHSPIVSQNKMYTKSEPHHSSPLLQHPLQTRFLYSSMLRCTVRRTCRLNSFISSRNSFEASMLAGELIFGDESIDTTDTKMDSMPMIGRQRSVALSNSLYLSSPGGCRIEMHTLPSG